MGTPVTLKFVFANHDGVVVELQTDLSALVRDVKQELLGSWPAELPAVESAAGFRLICMGYGILDDAKTLQACKVPVFAHPTPVNVSVRPPRTEAAAGGGGGGAAQGASDSGGCRCVVS